MRKDFIDRVRENLNNNKGPFKLDVFLTNRCNLKCVFCQFPQKSKESAKKEVPTEKMLDLLDSAAKMHTINFGVLGGEPFMRRDAMKIFKKSKKHRMGTSMVTNGTLLNTAELNELVEMEWNNLAFSLDGAKAQTHDKLRGIKGSFDKTFNAMTEINNIKHAKGKRLPDVELNFVMCKINFRELPEIVEICKQKGIGKLNILPLIPFTKESKVLQITNNKKVMIVLDNAEELAKKLEVHTNIDSIKKDYSHSRSDQAKDIILAEKQEPKNKGKIACYYPWIGLCVSSEGNVTPCAAAANHPSLELGNVKDKTLEYMWNSKKMKDLRKRMKNWDLPEACQRCCTLMIDENRELREALEND